MDRIIKKKRNESNTHNRNHQDYFPRAIGARRKTARQQYSHRQESSDDNPIKQHPENAAHTTDDKKAGTKEPFYIFLKFKVIL